MDSLTCNVPVPFVYLMCEKPSEEGPLRSQGTRPWDAKGGVVIPGCAPLGCTRPRDKWYARARPKVRARVWSGNCFFWVASPWKTMASNSPTAQGRLQSCGVQGRHESRGSGGVCLANTITSNKQWQAKAERRNKHAFQSEFPASPPRPSYRN